MSTPRVVEALNRALHTLMAEDDGVYLVGEDLLDPYGGAFKVSRGLSTRFPDRVLTTPLSEGGFVGLCAGLALCGERPIAEIMFGDFAALAFDAIVNFASKSVSMYGRHVPLSMVVRCAVGGGRGYGPTHSQSLQKHFLGVPGLELDELSPFHDPLRLLRRLVRLEHPAMLFEDKVLYTQQLCVGREVDDLFVREELGGASDFVRIRSESFTRRDVVFLAGGGVSLRCLAAMRRLFVEDELECELLVPARIHPLDLDPVEALLASAGVIITVEEGVAGGTWGGEAAQGIYERLWGRLARRVRSVTSASSIIPTASHLEREVIVQESDIVLAAREALGA